MVKTSPSDVWVKPIKHMGQDGVEFICHIEDQNEAVLATHKLMIGTTAGVMTQAAGMGTADHHDYDVEVAEDIADGDTYCLARKKAGKILHNQKLAGAYGIGDAVYKSAAGTWTQADSDTVAQSLLHTLGFVIGPADRITSSTVKGMDDAFTTTEPVDILI